MIQLQLPLHAIIIDPKLETDLTQLPEADARAALREAYSFLPPPVAIEVEGPAVTIRFPATAARNKHSAQLFERAASAANRGRYARAASLYQQLVEQQPASGDAHRNLGMALLESGDAAAAEEALLRALRLNPADAYALLLMGNIALGQRDDSPLAERYYRRAVAANPRDPSILANVGSLLAKRGAYAEARRFYQQAIDADPAYPHSRFGLALTYYNEGDLEAAITALDALFAQPEAIDIRTEQVYEEAQRLYARVNRELALANQEAYMASIRRWRDQLEAAGGVEIELVHDNRISTPAKAEVAWHDRGRHSHVIRYRDADPAILPHLLAHELQHIALEQAAREAKRNRLFITNDETRAESLRAIAADVHKLKRSGILGANLEAFLEQVITGLANQIFNMPLDMVIEHHLYHNQPQLRPTQFTSLAVTQAENAKVLSDPQIKQIAPRLIYVANVSMNAAFALFCDELFHGASNYAALYAGTRQYRDGRGLYARFLERITEFQPGDEYLLVDEIAAELKLQKWYTWRKDEALPAEVAGGPTNTDLLEQKEMASVMYCLSALRRFETMPRDEIYAIVREIALLGDTGIDYASAEGQYTLGTLPGESFSGLQLICMMYVGFKDIEPTLDIGIDLSRPYQMALTMRNPGAN